MAGLDLLAATHGISSPASRITWLESGPFRVTLGVLTDLPALVMGTLAAGCGWLTMRFAVDYLHREEGFHRFFLVLSLFVGGMMWVALADNAVLTFVGWEAAGIASYLLIGYAYDRHTATCNATRAVLTNRFGDAGFLFGIAMTFLFLDTLEWPKIFTSVTTLDSLLAGVMVGGFLVAALAKSAQLPFAGWIARALEGPTPSSAVFYGALMAHAGAFLVIRLEPLLWRAPFWLAVLMPVGLLTAVYATVAGRTQGDVKSALIFSTQAQLGLIFFECGAGLFEVALWHLTGHTIWRLYQFLLSPSYLHLSGRPVRPIPGWLAESHTFYRLALHRFHLDALLDALITHPTRALAQEVRLLDVRVFSRVTGRPLNEAPLPARVRKKEPVVTPGDAVTRGRGMLGHILQDSARGLAWFEEHLILRSSGEGLLDALTFLGGYVSRIEEFLGLPRYLFLLLALTFVVIL
ncbi:MAG: hypothetical protein HQM03_16520 [Magnetococcales bacterium]|nr:hypothetical protein [Magnetococcales bacterium]